MLIEDERADPGTQHWFGHVLRYLSLFALPWSLMILFNTGASLAVLYLTWARPQRRSDRYAWRFDPHDALLNHGPDGKQAWHDEADRWLSER
jgi:hypothetical protein